MLNSTNYAFLKKWAPQGQVLGKELHKTTNVVKGQYSFARDGGATGTYNLKDDDGNDIVIPSGAIVKLAYFDILTAFVTTSNDGTIAFQIQSANDIKTATDADTFSGVVACVPVNTAATMIKLTADRTLQMLIGTHAATAGKVNLYVEYVLGD